MIERILDLCGDGPRGRAHRRLVPGPDGIRLGDQAAPHRAIPEPHGCATSTTHGSRASTWPTTTSPRGRGLPGLVAQGLVATVVSRRARSSRRGVPARDHARASAGRFVRAALDRAPRLHRGLGAAQDRGRRGRTVLLKDPFRSEDARVDALIAAFQEATPAA